MKKKIKQKVGLSPLEIIQQENRKLQERLSNLKTKLNLQKSNKSDRFKSLFKKDLKDELLKNQSEVKKFLDNAKLAQYYDTLIANGFNEMETVKQIKSHHLEIMKFPIGHQIKFLKQLQGLNAKKSSSNLKQQKSSFQIQTDLIQRSVCQGCYKFKFGSQKFCNQQCRKRQLLLDKVAQQDEPFESVELQQSSQMQNEFIDLQKFGSQSEWQLPQVSRQSQESELDELKLLVKNQFYQFD